ncbi:MAG TPA: hypothetical protein VLT47_12365 [Anaeromyxobacteraceae bacterium]|nr:hypothetical protein [Anaeromyxobacteraceae bacterium]
MPAILLLLFAAATPPASPDRAPPEDPAAVARRGLAIASRGDPSIGEVLAAAARCADPAAAEAGALARGRIAALLPRLTAEVRFDDRSYRVVGLQASGEVDYTRQAPGWLAAVQASWDLGALVAPPADRVDAKGLLDRARRRDDAVRRATALFYERRRLRLALELAPPAAGADRAAAELEIERLAAELDALTGGAFTGALR